MPLTNSEIEQRLTRLLDDLDHGPSMTKQLFQHLDRIEDAMARGISRRTLAAQFDWSESQFISALAGARALSRQGGDRRRKRRPAMPAKSMATPIELPGGESLLKKF